MIGIDPENRLAPPPPTFAAVTAEWRGSGLAGVATQIHDKLARLLGVEGSIYLLDYVSRNHGKNLQFEAAAAFVDEMPTLRPVDRNDLRDAFDLIVRCNDADRSKVASLVKYTFSAELCDAVGLHVMNYGYRNGDSTQMEILPAELPIRHGLRLYHHLTRSLALEGRDVLEVGSGLGGGAAFISRTRSPRSYLGLDLVPAHIASSRAWGLSNGGAQLAFREGDAEALPISNESVHFVLNVESMHCYPHVDRFLGEAARVLHPGGSLHVADFYTRQHLDTVLKAAERAGLNLEHKEDINSGVKAALNPHLGEIRALGANAADRETAALYDRMIVTRTFDEPTSNWRNADLRYWLMRFQKAQR